MTDTIRAVYENGVLRPLTPLSLAEHAEVQLSIVEAAPDDSDDARRQFRSALIAAGVMSERGEAPAVAPLSAEERALLANRLAIPGAQPLSEVIIEERDER